jgi:excinuclease ABC subunit C
MTDKIKNILNIIPKSPGVYLMKDKDSNIIYVGKAIVLRNRVKQYFQTGVKNSEKTNLLVSNIEDIEYIVTNSEMEALILENNLIKAHKPKFNILLKDDKNYPFIKVTLNEDFPRVIITRKYKKDGARYFGPYSKMSLVKETLKIIKNIFSIKTCNKDLKKLYERPCLNYHIKMCHGPCTGQISKEDYKKIIKDVCDFLNGNQKEFLDELNNKMVSLSENLEFEKAAEYRDKILSLKHLIEKQRVVSSIKEDMDIIVSSKDEKDIIVMLFFIRGGVLIGNKDFTFKNESKSSLKDIITSFIKQYYINEQFIPKSLIIEYYVEEKDAISNWLSEKKGSKVNITVPKRGEKLDYLQMAKDNAKIILKKKIILGVENLNLAKLLEKVKNLLNIDNQLNRIEAYDISNTGISEVVGSMIVFENGKENKKLYRRFKIKNHLNSPNDYYSMQEVIFRRFKRFSSSNSEDESFSQKPDLILLDGGLGHVSAINDVLKELEIKANVFGMVKDSKHRTRAIISQSGEINIRDDMEIFRFFTKIQNEVHRYAIEYNKVLRAKRYRESELDNIEGIGPKKKSELLKYFGSVNKIKTTDLEELSKVNGVSKELAVKIYDYFRSNK